MDEHTGGVNSVKCVTVLKIPASVGTKLAVLGEPKCCVVNQILLSRKNTVII